MSPTRQLQRHFARRMLPLALAAGLVVAAAPPLAYRIVAWRQLRQQATLYATEMAAAVQRAVEHAPYFWRYNSPKILSAIAGHRGQRDIGGVTVHDCSGQPIFTPASLGIGSGTAGGPSGSTPVLLGSQMVARVQVSMDPQPQRAVLSTIALAAGALGALLGGLLFWFPTRVVRRQAGLLEDALQQRARAENELRTLNQELAARVAASVAEVRQLSERMVHLQEEERQRIARDLHDGVGQAVTALQIELRLAGKGGDAGLGHHPEAGQTCRHLAESVRLAEEILGQIRGAVFALQPAELGSMGLEQALRECVERFEIRTAVPACFRVEGDPRRVPERQAVELLRIAQEALTNISRHAAAREVGVCLEVTGEALRLTVQDDGRGLAAGALAQGSGLRGMQERAAFLGGRLEVSRGEPQGTLITVTLPVDPVDP